MVEKQIPGLEVITNLNTESPPCPHGPTLLFKRISDGKEKRFFACSACRDRKDCSFFLREDEKFTESKKKVWNLVKEHVIPKVNHGKVYEQFVRVLKKAPQGRAFCHTCNELMISSEIKSHKDHKVKIGISNRLLNFPSELLQPLENAKKEAQYLFSKHTVKTIVDIICSLNVKKVLCMGTPRIHEYICSEASKELSSLLLDIDHRYHHFISPERFCWYNLFNNYFFSEDEGCNTLTRFLSEGDSSVVLVMDPPFGGRVEPLAKTIQEINKLQKKLHFDSDIKVLWTFPYFMEPQILASCPEFTMLDYKVDYDNHPLFVKGTKGRKYGSPVRIFTNEDPKNIILPKEEGYRYCEICERWVSEENKHCSKCNKCTSKNGRTYVHCDKCNRCVKPSWKHCSACDRCCLPDHQCGEILLAKLCFSCGESGHKKHDCPNLKRASLISANAQRIGKKRKHMHRNVTQSTKLASNKKVKKNCSASDRCSLPDHQCGEILHAQLCFNCGESGHKKHDCPKLKRASLISANAQRIGKKRKQMHKKVKKNCMSNVNDKRKKKL